jgi:hypothetical protein
MAFSPAMEYAQHRKLAAYCDDIRTTIKICSLLETSAAMPPRDIGSNGSICVKYDTFLFSRVPFHFGKWTTQYDRSFWSSALFEFSSKPKNITDGGDASPFTKIEQQERHISSFVYNDLIEQDVPQKLLCK